MSDDRLELPLFEQPPGASGTDAEDAPRVGEPVDPAAETVGDDSGDPPVVVETLDLPLEEEAQPADEPQPAGVGSRLAAGFIDLLVHVAVTGILIGGSALLEAPIGWRHAVPLAVVLAIFSFVYHVVPLAFWGGTPGMAIAGLRARTLDDEPLSLPQATRHWLALLLTAATAGLGVLLALGGRSLADRLSGSQTLLE